MGATDFLLEQSGTKRIDYPSATAYADAVRQWLTQSASWYDMHIRMMVQMQLGALPLPLLAGVTVAGVAQPSAAQTREGPHTFRIPPFYKRICAEAFDFIFAFVIKLFLVYIFVELGAFELERYERFFENSADLHTIIEITEELFPMEIVGKVICSVAEALCISKGFPQGQTPGKLLMGIRVVSCHSVQSGPRPDEVIVTGLPKVPFVNSLVRSLIKNLVINFLLPLSSVAYAFSFNRAVYDLAAKTLVVCAD